jgi:5'-deoxynucleotidase YfbR-like HD superfamily hydrolase
MRFEIMDNLRWLYDSTETRRFHARRRLIHEQTVGEHSARVALLLIYLHERFRSLDIESGISDAENLELVRHAILHDLGEQDSGDIPSPSKRALGIALTIDVIEREAVCKFGGIHVTPLPTEAMQTRFKLADCLDGMMTCVRERELGNRTLYKVFDVYLSYLEKLPLSPQERSLVKAVGDLWEAADER